MDERYLQFEILRNDSLGIAMGGSSGVAIPYDLIELYDADGEPNASTVVASSVLRGETINVGDAYTAQGFDFSGTRKFDEKTGYRSKSFLTVPMKNHDNEIIGVLQLINARAARGGEIIPFSEADQRLVESLASQAAIALTNRLLIAQLEELFESFVRLIDTALDEKSPYTGGHCARVPVLTMMLADAANAVDSGPLADFRLAEKDRYELRIAAMLHDCGKIVTPVHVVDKATKLETIFDRIQLIEARFEVLRRDAEIRLLRERSEARGKHGQPAVAAIERRHEEYLRQLEADLAFLRGANMGSEFMSKELQERIDAIARKYTWTDREGRRQSVLSENEASNLKIPRGTLTPEERDIIDYHSTATIKMLNALPWPKHLRRVPEYAGAHHERMDGKGYPKGLTADEMPVPARIVAIADIFEALTAKDRPYKSGKKLSEALAILGRMRLDNHIDPQLFDVFIRQRVYERYAREFLAPEQLDEVDVGKIPGFAP